MLTPQDLVTREVCACASSLIATIAAADFQRARSGDPMTDMIEQAMDLAGPIDDWAEAAIQAGFVQYAQGQDVMPPDRETTWWYRQADPSGDWWRTAQEACEDHELGPYEWEVFEHWIVSDWFADKLDEEGEKVDKDFAGLCIWARTTTGQAIYADGVIERICAKINAGA